MSTTSVGGVVDRDSSAVAAIIVCGGSGQRFGSDKLSLRVGGKPVWQWSADAFARHPKVTECVIVAHEALLPRVQAAGYRAVAGGSTRQESVAAGLAALKGNPWVLIHDGARPGISAQVIDRVIAAMQRDAAAMPVLPVVDTILDTDSHQMVNRTPLRAIQTPLGARHDDLLRAYASPDPAATDDSALLNAIGIKVSHTEGERDNMKITNEEDGAVITRLLAVPETRTGLGYDIHAFSANPSRPLYLGGLLFTGAQGLEGHSDADVLLHAITDSLLGAIAGGDIGLLFPNTDPAHKDAPSRRFVEEAARLVREAGWTVEHIDACVVAERPKIMARSVEIREAVAHMVGIDLDRVSLKATTNEGLGSLGRGEGIAAWATATVSRWRTRSTSS